MKVTRIETDNFAGLGSVVVDGIGDHEELIISGRNGVGKTQLLLCIALATRFDVASSEAAKYISAGSSKAELTVDFQLDAGELSLLQQTCYEYDESFQFVGSTLRSVLTLYSSREPVQKWEDSTGNSSLTGILNELLFRGELPFADVIYLPSDRIVERSPDLTFSLKSLARSTTREIGQQTLIQQIADWNSGHVFDVFSSLAALHYAGVLRERETTESSVELKDFREIIEAFKRATGKDLEEPRVRPDGSIGLDVTLPGGSKHSVNTLSTGELLALQLMQFVKSHLQRGSILLIDEPEQHLHPSLQLEIANTVRNGVGSGQLWMSTHSPNLLNSVPQRNVLVLTKNSDDGKTQITFADTESARLELLSELGVAPGLWVPGNFLVIVEGPSDERLLRQLLPEEFASAFFVVAGNKSSVKSLADRQKLKTSVPFLAICDRDLWTDDEADAWNSADDQFTWSGSAIEAIFLDVNWLWGTLRDLEPELTTERVREKLRDSFEKQKDTVRSRWMKKTIESQIPSEENSRESLEANLDASIKVARERRKWLDDHETDLEGRFESLWTRNARALVNPKRALSEFNNESFKGVERLKAAMISVYRRGDVDQSDDLMKLSQKINKIRSKVWDANS